MREFVEIYDIRSRIVHEGKSALSMHEHGRLIALRSPVRPCNTQGDRIA